jgi:hypothetical protein
MKIENNNIPLLEEISRYFSSLYISKRDGKLIRFYKKGLIFAAGVHSFTIFTNLDVWVYNVQDFLLVKHIFEQVERHYNIEFKIVYK